MPIKPRIKKKKKKIIPKQLPFRINGEDTSSWLCDVKRVLNSFMLSFFLCST